VAGSTSLGGASGFFGDLVDRVWVNQHGFLQEISVWPYIPKVCGTARESANTIDSGLDP
jgi:hypothetical protein